MLEPFAVPPVDVPYGGATSFAAAEDYASTSADEAVVDYEIDTFAILLANIRASGMSSEEKVDAVEALTDELRARLNGGDPGSMMVFKDNSGSYRWVAVHSNKFEDHQSETFSEKAHVDWVDRVWGRKEFPALRLWHMPMDIGRADWVDYDTEGFVLSSGKFNPGMEDVAERLSKMKGLGCSHGYLYRAEDLRNGVYNAYRSYEVSVLPARRVANDLTAFFAGEEIPMLTPDRRQFLVDVMGEDRAKSMEESVKSLAAIAQQRGLSYKSLETALLDDVAAEAAEQQGERAFPPGDESSDEGGDNATGDQQQKCPDCDAMVAAADMPDHQREVHGQEPAAAGVVAPEAQVVAPAAAAAAQQGVTLPTAAVSPALAAPAPAAAPGLSPGAVLAGVGEILEGVGHMLDGGAGEVNDPTDPDAAKAAAFVEANKAVVEVVPDALGEDDPMVAAFKSAVAPILTQVRDMATRQEEMQREIASLKSDRGAEIADAIRPRVGYDGRTGVAASQSNANLASDAEAARIVAASGGKKDDESPTTAAATPYVADLTSRMRNGVGASAH